jgi:hypothetical protein
MTTTTTTPAPLQVQVRPDDSAYRRQKDAELARVVRHKVVFQRVAIRSAASRGAAIIGSRRAGDEVQSSEQAGNWIRLCKHCAPAGTDPTTGAWMMLEGSELGLGRLLVRLPEPWEQGSRQQGTRRGADAHSTHGTHGRQHADWRMTADEDGKYHLAPTQFSNRDSVQRAQTFLKQQPRSERETATACDGPAVTCVTTLAHRYRVVHRPRMAIRARPSTDASIIGVVAAGSEIETSPSAIEGQSRDKWLKLTTACWIRLTGRLAVSEAWMLLDGREVGLAGPLLEAVE